MYFTDKNTATLERKRKHRSNPSLSEHGTCPHTSALGKAEGQGAESENKAGHPLVVSFFSCSKMDIATLKVLWKRCRTPEMEGERAPCGRAGTMKWGGICVNA